MVKCEKWKKCLDIHIKKAFQKVKVKSHKVKTSAANALIDKRNSLKNNSLNAQARQAFDLQIEEVLLKEEIEKAKHFKKFCNATSTFPLHQMWKLKKKLWPKKQSTLPIAKKNHRGRLISSPKELIQTFQKEYKDRLRQRKGKHNLKENMERMHEVTKL